MDDNWGYSHDKRETSLNGNIINEYLVGGLEHEWIMTLHSVGNVIIPTDFHSYFAEGRYTTNQLYIYICVYIYICLYYIYICVGFKPSPVMCGIQTIPSQISSMNIEQMAI